MKYLFHSCTSPSSYLQSISNNKVIEIVQLFLELCSIRSTKFNPNRSALMQHLFHDRPLLLNKELTFENQEALLTSSNIKITPIPFTYSILFCQHLFEKSPNDPPLFPVILLKKAPGSDLRDEIFSALLQEVLVRHPGNKITDDTRRGCLRFVIGGHPVKKLPVDVR